MKGIKTVSLILFEFSFGMQIMIVVVYWTAIHAWLMARLEAIGAHDLIILNYIIHILPFANIFFNVTFSNIKFRYSHVIFTILISLVFFVFNYFGVLHFNNGEPLYPFFPWATDFEKSLINGVVLLIIASLVYLGTCIYINKGLRQYQQVIKPKKTN